VEEAVARGMGVSGGGGGGGRTREGLGGKMAVAKSCTATAQIAQDGEM
jgi:hypothetical protein